jgi:hypothetical protein
VVFSTEDKLLHGDDTLKAIVDTGAPIEVTAIRDIPQVEFEATDWPEILEAARQMFMKGARLDDDYVAWVKKNAA